MPAQDPLSPGQSHARPRQATASASGGVQDSQASSNWLAEPAIAAAPSSWTQQSPRLDPSKDTEKASAEQAMAAFAPLLDTWASPPESKSVPLASQIASSEPRPEARVEPRPEIPAASYEPPAAILADARPASPELLLDSAPEQERGPAAANFDEAIFAALAALPRRNLVDVLRRVAQRRPAEVSAAWSSLTPGRVPDVYEPPPMVAPLAPTSAPPPARGVEAPSADQAAAPANGYERLGSTVDIPRLDAGIFGPDLSSSGVRSEEAAVVHAKPVASMLAAAGRTRNTEELEAPLLAPWPSPGAALGTPAPPSPCPAPAAAWPPGSPPVGAATAWPPVASTENTWPPPMT